MDADGMDTVEQENGMNELSEVWCSKCTKPATQELRRGAESVALCDEDATMELWKANSPSWNTPEAK